MAATATRRRPRSATQFSRTKPPPAPQNLDWTPRKALRSAGIRASQATRRGALDARHYAGAPGRVAAADPTGAAELILYVVASILALALLENVLGGRGPAAVAKVLEVLGGGIRKLVDPTDPLFGPGPAGSSAAAGASAAGEGSSSAGTGTSLGGGPASAGGYRNPLGALSGVIVGRTDQGLDFEAGAANVGKPIVVPADAKVVAVSRNYGGYGQYVAFKLLGNKYKSTPPIFVGHSTVANVKVGDTLPAGATVAFVKGYNSQPGHIELGYASPAHPYETLARSVGGVDPVTHYSQAGQQFTDWFLGLFGKGAK